MIEIKKEGKIINVGEWNYKSLYERVIYYVIISFVES